MKSNEDTQTLDDVIETIFWSGYDHGGQEAGYLPDVLKRKWNEDVKQSIKQSLLANMPEKKPYKKDLSDEEFGIGRGFNKAIDECTQVIEDLLK